MDDRSEMDSSDRSVYPPSVAERTRVARLQSLLQAWSVEGSHNADLTETNKTSRVTPAICLEMLTTGKYTDLIIDCQGVKFSVHRMVICPQSAMLSAACNGNFQEAQTGEIKFPEEDPKIMARTIFFMYTNNYDEHTLPIFYTPLTFGREKNEAEATQKSQPKETDKLGLGHPLNVNVLMYKCAEMLGIDDLQALASSRFLSYARGGFDLDGFEEPMRLLYESTRPDDRDLRLKFTKLCVENHGRLESRKKLLAILQEHEPNVWNVSVELWKESHDLRHAYMAMAVAKFNSKRKHTYCPHGNDYRSIRLVMDSQASLSLECDLCPEENGTSTSGAGHAS